MLALVELRGGEVQDDVTVVLVRIAAAG